MTPAQEVQALLEKNRLLHENKTYTALSDLRRILEGFLPKMVARPEDRMEFGKEMEKLVELIDYPSTEKGKYCARQVIGYTMRDLKWPEVEAALKERYAREPDASIQLWMESLIRNIYDKGWEGGVCVSMPEESIWDA